MMNPTSITYSFFYHISLISIQPWSGIGGQGDSISNEKHLDTILRNQPTRNIEEMYEKL